MDINWLEDFACLARNLNFSRAAEERNITQPAFSRRIRSLENWVGVPLIKRSTYPVRLSEAGIQFLPFAQETISNLTDIRQAIRGEEFGRAAFQRVAVLHTISVNFLTQRISELESDFPNLQIRVYSDYLPTCCQLFSDGTCDFLLCYRHKNDGPFFDDDQISRKDIGVERLIPVADAKAAAKGNWDISDPNNKNIPYLSYDPDSYLGTVVEKIIGSRRPPFALRYMDAHAEALKRRVLAGSGVAWLSESIVAAELASGALVPVGGPEWQTSLTLTLFSSLDRLDEAGQQLWKAL